MPQIFQVLRCYKCLIFQVHQTKKLNKWECKLCGEKQSHKRHYGLGTAKECRFHVQKLNSLYANVNEQNSILESEEDFENNVENPKENIDLVQPKKGSKWDDYIDKTEHNMAEFVEEEGNMFIDDKKVVLERPKKHKKMTGTDHYKNKKTILNSSQHTNTDHNINTEQNENFSTLITENDNILSQVEKKSSTRKTSLKFVPPKINVHSKWVQYNEKSKGEDDEIINNSICNTFKTNNIELQNSSNYSKPVHTSETIKSKSTITNINVNSKWAKFTEDDNFCKNIFKSSLNNNSREYETDANNLSLNFSNNSFERLLDKNACLQNISNNMKKSTVTSLFDDGDLDILDI